MEARGANEDSEDKSESQIVQKSNFSSNRAKKGNSKRKGTVKTNQMLDPSLNASKENRGKSYMNERHTFILERLCSINKGLLGWARQTFDQQH